MVHRINSWVLLFNINMIKYVTYHVLKLPIYNILSKYSTHAVRILNTPDFDYHKLYKRIVQMIYNILNWYYTAEYLNG